MTHLIKNSLYLLLVVNLFLACNKDGDLLRTRNFKISEIETRQDYLAPLLLEKDVDGNLVLNNEEIEFNQGIYELNDAGFYELIINSTDTTLFVLLDKERGEAEWGLKKWIPEEPIIQDKFNDELEIIHPQYYVQGTAIPFIFKTENWTKECSTNLVCTSSIGSRFMIKKGIGSQSEIINNTNHTFTINEKEYYTKLSNHSSEVKVLDHDITTPTILAPNTVIQLKKEITISQSGSLTLQEGTILIIDEGVNMTNYGSIHFNGTIGNPILVTCTKGEEYFGGFISEGSAATIDAAHTFFSHFGQHSETEYQYGHAKHQALFKSTNTKLTFNNCYFIDTPGQVFYPFYCDLTLENCIVQRAKTSGQINSSKLIIKNSYLSDFPDDSQEYRDEDNDAIYLSATNATILNSLFMYTKDDGIDTGGNEGGAVNIDSCWFEACFHEGIAMSSGDQVEKTHIIKNSTFTNCQQGAELGYSSPNHSVLIDNCIFDRNYIGVRFGDNYKNDVNGIIWLRQSTYQSNHRNYWNMVHQIWAPKTNNLIIE